jgi:amino acid adenylation domain-containing protein
MTMESIDPWLLHGFFERAAEAAPDAIALRCSGEDIRYGELDQKSGSLAHALLAQRLRAGDRVLLLLDNGVPFVVALLGTLRAGCVAVPLNPGTKAHKLRYLLGDCEPAVLVYEASLESVVASAVEGIRRPRLLRSGCLPAAAGAERLDAEDFAMLSGANGAIEPLPVRVIDRDLATLIYTSGSTGEPKGVMLSHLNMVSALKSVSGFLGLRRDDRIFCGLPLAFDYGLYQLLMSWRVGATVILERSLAFPAAVLQALERENATVLPGVPTFFAMLTALDGLAPGRAPVLRILTNTAAALPMAHIERLRQLFPAAQLFSMYGLTECKRVSYLPPAELAARPGSVGRGMPNQECWLVDEKGRRLPSDRTGELVVRGSNVMRGYWRKSGETAERLRVCRETGETLLHTGDIFRTDSEGYLYFVARRDDIIKSRGEKVSPREVEDAICTLEGVLEAAVIGVTDLLLGQAIKAFVVPRTGFHVTPASVIHHCRARLEPHLVPQQVEIVDALPRTETGKIRRRSLA